MISKNDKEYLVDLLNGSLQSATDFLYDLQDDLDGLESANNINNPDHIRVKEDIIRKMCVIEMCKDKIKYIEELTIKVINLPTTENNGSI